MLPNALRQVVSIFEIEAMNVDRYSKFVEQWSKES